MLPACAVPRRSATGGPVDFLQRIQPVVDRWVVTLTATTTITNHLIAAPDGWWETYDPLVEAWEATLKPSDRSLGARVAAYILLDAPLLRRGWAKPDPTRPEDSWEGLDAEELLSHDDLHRCPPSIRLAVLRDLAKFVDYLGSINAIPSAVWIRVREGYDAQAARLLTRWREEEADTLPLRCAPKVGRNHPCPCGSGAKYKRCCLAS